jgi:hypothetical protein
MYAPLVTVVSLIVIGEAGEDVPALCHGAVMDGTPSTTWLPKVLLKEAKPRYDPI